MNETREVTPENFPRGSRARSPSGCYYIVQSWRQGLTPSHHYVGLVEVKVFPNKQAMNDPTIRAATISQDIGIGKGLEWQKLDEKEVASIGEI